MTAGRVLMRPARWSDLEGIWRVCSAHHDDFRGMTLEQFRDIFTHRWLENPARTDAHAFGWVLADEKSVHGFLGLVPVVFQVDGKDVTGASGTTWVVDPAFRSRSLELYMPYMAWGDGHLLIDTTAGEVAGKCHAGLRRGMRHIPVPEFGERLLWIWKPSAVITPVVGRLAKAGGWRAWGSLPTFRPLLALALWVRFLPHRRVPASPAGFSVEEAHAAPAQLDELWERHRGAYGVTAKRGATFIGWRVFGSTELRRRTRLLVCRRGGAVVAYLVLYQKTVLHFLVADLFPMSTEPEARHALLRRAWELARGAGGGVLEVYGFHPTLMAETRALGAFAARADLWTYWYKTPPGPLVNAVAHENAWWPSGLDGDINM